MLDADKTYWFPMRVTYGREVFVKNFLDGEKIETFLPMTDKAWRDGGRIRHKLVPAVSNLLFVRSEKKRLDLLKHTRRDAEPLRYMIRPVSAERNAMNEIITVPDRQMYNFMKVAEGPEDQRTFLTASDLQGHAGDTVTITSGPFAGVEGVIKRIKGNRRVVVEIEGVAGVCINFVPSKFMIKTSD